MWKFEVYEDAADKFRWRLKAGNGEIVASSGESFASKENPNEQLRTSRTTPARPTARETTASTEPIVEVGSA